MVEALIIFYPIFQLFFFDKWSIFYEEVGQEAVRFQLK